MKLGKLLKRFEEQDDAQLVIYPGASFTNGV